MQDKLKYIEELKHFKCCIIIPTYNNDKTIENIINQTLTYTENIIIINDGSTDNTNQILSKYSNIHIISYAHNKGKGYALRKGFEYAIIKGYDYAITIDSDGQHIVDDISVFIDKLKSEPNSIIIGARNMNQENVPGKNNFGNKFSNFWFRFETGINMTDTQSGYRLYPLTPLKDLKFFTTKYEFEIEVIVRAAWKEIKVVSVPINVIYSPKESRVTHFRPFKDFSRISILNTILVFIAIFYIKPLKFFKSINKENIQNFKNKHLLNKNESDKIKILSVMLGIFMSVVPVWGYQMLIALFLAYIFKLNKIIVIVASNLSIPPLIPLILYFSYKTGEIILPSNSNNILNISNISLEFVKNNLIQYIIGSFVFAILLSICFGFLTFLYLKFFSKRLS